MNTEFKIAAYASPEYERTISLRYRILREPLGLDFTPEQLAEEHNHIHIYGINKDGQIIACLVLVRINEKELKMRQVAVDNSVQRNGVGTRLVVFSEQWAIENGYSKITLHARKSAVPFYLRLKYDIIGEPFEEVGIPHRKMKKDLN